MQTIGERATLFGGIVKKNVSSAREEDQLRINAF